MVVLFSVIMGGMELGQAAPGLGTVLAGKQAARHALKTIKRAPLIDQGSSAGISPADCAGSVSLRGVRFVYPARPTVPVLRSLSLDVPAGTSMALVGHSGCGKSTVVQLLQRFYDPCEGAVFLDGVDLRQLSIRWLRSKMGLVQQEVRILCRPLSISMRVACAVGCC